MKQYIKNKIIKSNLTMKGEHISESEKKQFISFLTRLNHVSIVLDVWVMNIFISNIIQA